MTARFEPIGLAELERRAALMRRVDRKYLLDREQLDELLERAPRDCRVLQIDGRTRFRYRSTYYDSPELASYRAAALGRRRRWKVRTRDYLDTGSSFLEVKTRATRQSDKHRIPAERVTPDLVGPGSLLVPYGTVSALAPDLPRTRWSRTLRRHFC